MAEKKFLNLVTTKYLVLSFLLVIPVLSFSTGGGEESCVTLRPNHDVNRPQTSPPPYTLQVSRTTFTPGEIITVTVASGANDIGAQTYMGISLQARRTDDSLRAIGSWVIPNSNFQYLNCLNSPQGTLTHTSSADKTLPMNFQWASPVNSSGDVIFTATIVQKFDIFWADVHSHIVQDITVQPELPTINCPMDIRVPSQPGASGSNVEWIAPTCVDATNGQSLVVNCSPTSNSFFITGVTSVTCFCTSPQQAMTTCTFTATVESPPVIICPSVMQISAQGNNIGAFVTWKAPTCIGGEEGLLDATCDMNSGSLFLAPQTIVTCTCTNMGGSEATCDFMVDLIDRRKKRVATDIPGGSTCQDVFCKNGGTYENFYGYSFCRCANGYGGPTCAVEESNASPVITCPADVVEFSLVNNVGNTVSWDSPVCTDAEDTPGTTTAVCDTRSGSFFRGTGVTKVSCTCTGSAGNSSTCTFNVNILDSVDSSEGFPAWIILVPSVLIVVTVWSILLIIFAMKMKINKENRDEENMYMTNVTTSSSSLPQMDSQGYAGIVRNPGDTLNTMQCSNSATNNLRSDDSSEINYSSHLYNIDHQYLTFE